MNNLDKLTAAVDAYNSPEGEATTNNTSGLLSSEETFAYWDRMLAVSKEICITAGIPTWIADGENLDTDLLKIVAKAIDESDWATIVKIGADLVWRGSQSQK